MDKKELLYKLLNDYVEKSLSIEDDLDDYLKGNKAKIEIAKKVKEAYKSLDVFSDYIRRYTID